MKASLIILLLTVTGLSVTAQEKSLPVNALGLMVEYGIGRVAIQDEFISAERYTGTLPYIGIWYGRLEEKKGFPYSQPGCLSLAFVPRDAREESGGGESTYQGTESKPDEAE